MIIRVDKCLLFVDGTRRCADNYPSTFSLLCFLFVFWLLKGTPSSLRPPFLLIVSVACPLSVPACVSVTVSVLFMFSCFLSYFTLDLFSSQFLAPLPPPHSPLLSPAIFQPPPPTPRTHTHTNTHTSRPLCIYLCLSV